jgi:hypothetical protein
MYVGDEAVGISDRLPQLRQDVAKAEGDEDAELAEQAADGVEASGARLHPGGARAVQRSDRLLR